MSSSWQQFAHIITVLIPGERGKEEKAKRWNIEPRNVQIANTPQPVNGISDLVILQLQFSAIC